MVRPVVNLTIAACRVGCAGRRSSPVSSPLTWEFEIGVTVAPPDDAPGREALVWLGLSRRRRCDPQEPESAEFSWLAGEFERGLAIVPRRVRPVEFGW